LGGKRPPDINARVLAHQAWYFAATGQRDVARAVAEQALALALKVPPNADSEVARLRANLDSFIASFPPDRQPPRLKDPWRVVRRPFFVQAAVLAVAVSSLSLLMMSSNGSHAAAWHPQAAAPTTPRQPYTAAPPSEAFDPTTAVPVMLTPPRETHRVKPAYVRPALAPDGHPWPRNAAYLKGLPLKYKDGYSEVTVDNSGNNSDVFVKLVSTSGKQAFPVRQFYIPAHGSFVAKNLRAGNYDVRYLDLASGDKAGTPSFALSETEMSDGIQYSRYELTLYTVANGNLQTRPLRDDEF
jgi:hypothetical protein